MTPPAYYIPKKYASITEKAAYDNGIPLWLFARLIDRESKWNAKALRKNRNGTKDIGIAQFNSAYLSDFVWFDNDGKPFDPWVPAEALPVAARYVRRLYRATKDWKETVMAYNAGLGAVRRGQSPSSTLLHAEIIMGGYKL